jgi:hypothetical protein
VGSFLSALSSAGFTFVGISYQPYLKAYTTTFHAMQIDALPFDFVFFFQKRESSTSSSESRGLDLEYIQQELIKELETSKSHLESERDFRMKTYPRIIPLLVCPDWGRVKSLAAFYERLVRKEDNYFKSVRKHRIEKRRNENVKTLQ